LIGGLLNSYDLALVQEDFAYPQALRERLRLPYASTPFERGERLDFGDGLSEFAKLPLTETKRASWRACHGYTDSYFDCLTPKGFRKSRFQLETGVTVDVYNLHLDAGRSSGDRAARAAQLRQLARAIRDESDGRPLIVAGDFNLGRSEHGVFAAFENETGLRDSCTALGCPEPGRIDRVLVRSTSTVRLVPLSWRTERRFVDSAGRPLSDHLPVVVELAWETS
jgi:endonuclease/exonuclease/phosphatase family metal-dependent hydrolase